MSEASIKSRKIKVVIWNKKIKNITYYIINHDTTIQEIIDYLELKNVCMALLGINTHPFELMPCDYSEENEDCKANNFSIKVYDMLMSSPDISENLEQFLLQFFENRKIEDITYEERIVIIEKAKEQFCYNEDFCKERSIHLFLYNHKENDLRTEDYNEWSKKDWKLTTDESSLWLQLEKKYLTEKMNKDYDWTEAMIND